MCRPKISIDMNGNFKNLIKNKLFSILNQKLVDYIYFIYGCTISKKSYSQFAEDLLVWNYFQYKNIKKGKYLDIGSFHPVWISNTHLLHKKGFEGYCIDLCEEKLKFFKFLRGNKVKTICGAVSPEKKKFIDFYKFLKKHSFSEIDTISKDTADRYAKKFGLSYKILKIKNYHVDEIFRITGKINFLNIDIEGLDKEVLLNCNLKIADPEIVVFEDNSNLLDVDPELEEFLKENNYFRLFVTRYSKGFAKK